MHLAFTRQTEPESSAKSKHVSANIAIITAA